MPKNNEPRERSLILYPHEVRGVLEGRISQIRRPVGGFSPVPPGATRSPEVVDGYIHWWDANGDRHQGGKLGPFGQPGDLLVCKEVWAQPGTVARSDDPVREDGRILYRADTDGALAYSWRSPATMPRWASRITLKNEAVRVQRVQEASEEDAFAEGFYQAVRESATGIGQDAPGWLNWHYLSVHGNCAGSWTWVCPVSRINKDQP